MLKVASLAEVGQHTAEGVALTQKITATLAVSGATSSVYFGFSQGEWSIIGIICGIVIGALGLAGNLAVTIWFKHQHLKIARQKAGLDSRMGDID